MVLTKADLQQLKEMMDSTLATSIASLESNLENKFIHIEQKITDRIVNLESSINSEISEIKLANATLTNQIQDDNVIIKNELNELRDKHSNLEEKTLEAYGRIEILKSKIIDLEKSVHNGLQHNRKWNVEIEGIPNNVGDDPKQLEDAAIKILRAINVSIVEKDIEAIHRLPSRNEIKPTIIRFNNRKTVDSIFYNKHKLL